ncbi:MAG: phosphoribosylanthranilate isomerase [Oscillospiraceae bacterium]|nr:phosphoribosylanthranilate isomerase [Oscillospiraceae bacterium]
MTKIKLCGLSRQCDIAVANMLRPAYIGFVFAPKSRRYVTPETAAQLRAQLHPHISAVGVFVNETPEAVAALLHQGIIDIAQLHGNEDENYLQALRQLTEKPIIQAFQIGTPQDVAAAQNSCADYILLDAGGGTGTVFDWHLIRDVKRPFFLAGGLNAENVKTAVQTIAPYAVDVSSGIETNGQKDPKKMKQFVLAVHSADEFLLQSR